MDLIKHAPFCAKISLRIQLPFSAGQPDSAGIKNLRGICWSYDYFQ